MARPSKYTPEFRRRAVEEVLDRDRKVVYTESMADKAPPGEHAWVDGPPQLKGLGVPFVSFGPRPALFDAPASTESDIRFVADSFLTASPDAVLSRVSQPCFGFRWGYATKAGSAAELLPLSALDVGDWRDALPLLEREFPDWTFAKEWAG